MDHKERTHRARLHIEVDRDFTRSIIKSEQVKIDLRRYDNLEEEINE